MVRTYYIPEMAPSTKKMHWTAHGAELSIRLKTIGAELPPELLEEARAMNAKIIGNRVWIAGGFTFHDIKAKGVTDHEQHESGHLTAKMKAIYNRKPKEVKATT